MNRTIRVDDRVDAYESLHPAEWAERVFKSVPVTSVYRNPLLDLLMSWRSTGYVAAFPAASARMCESTLQGYVREGKPNGSVIEFGENILQSVVQQVPELTHDLCLQEKLLKALVNSALRLVEGRDRVGQTATIDEFWPQFLADPAFQMTVWSSQRLAYVSFYNAYEAFLVECAKLASSETSLRTQSQEFKTVLRNSFARDVYDSCWSSLDISVAREIRHSLSHAGGRLTEKLLRMKHQVLVEDGCLQILPDDNKALLHCLRKGVDSLVESI